MRQTAQDGQSDERGIARLCLRMIDYPGQPRERGKFGEGKMSGSGSSSSSAPKAKSQTAVDPKGHTITKSYDPNDYSNVAVGHKGNTEETPTGRFQSKTKLASHQRRHGKAMGYKNEREYSEAGVSFLSRPLGENCEEIHLTDGSRMRYNYSTNEFACTNSDGNMTSFYHPNEGIQYWEGMVSKHGRQ